MKTRYFRKKYVCFDYVLTNFSLNKDVYEKNKKQKSLITKK